MTQIPLPARPGPQALKPQTSNPKLYKPSYFWLQYIMIREYVVNTDCIEPQHLLKREPVANTVFSKHQTLNPEPHTLNPKPQTPHQTPNTKPQSSRRWEMLHCGRRLLRHARHGFAKRMALMLQSLPGSYRQMERGLGFPKIRGAFLGVPYNQDYCSLRSS